MKVYRFKQIISKGLRLDSDLDDMGREGWELRAVTYLGRNVKGALGSEKGITTEDSSAYVYHFQREIEPHDCVEKMIPSQAGICSFCGLGRNHRIHRVGPNQDERTIAETRELIKEARRAQVKSILDICHDERRGIEYKNGTSPLNPASPFYIAHDAVVRITRRIEAKLEEIKQS